MWILLDSVFKGSDDDDGGAVGVEGLSLV